MCNCRACQEARENYDQLNGVIYQQQERMKWLEERVQKLESKLATWAPWDEYND